MKKEDKEKLIKQAAKLGVIVIALLCLFLAADVASAYLKNRVSADSDLKINAADITPRKLPTYPEYLQGLKNLFSSSAKSGKDELGKKFELVSAMNNRNWDRIKLAGTLINSSVSLAILTLGDKNYSVTKGEGLGDWRVNKITKSTVSFEGEGETKTIMINYSGEGGNVLTEEASTSGASAGTILTRQDVNNLIEPPDRLAQEATFMPVAQGGISGVKLAYLKEGSLLQKIGLTQNDVLLEVNGESLKTGNDIFKAYQAFRNEDHIAIRLNRGGEEKNIKLEIR